jgi:enoyl-CoA hydratase
VRLPRLIGASRAMDLILTGRPVGAAEALAMGLANRVVPDGQALSAAVELAKQIAAFPQGCLRNDRRSALDQWSLSWDEAVAREIELGIETLRSGEAAAGAARFTSGEGRGGVFK